ncbi:hypothetical protein [Helicobacter pullorum]|uniref:hypothetical protein n=1 Tax=Helicobacter pullorum TaxID=35818 RepID=UPI000816A803|nr:hypothetical protein [Helicobacter pullorum]OCR15582.1 hypothetical protein BA915_04995 [Helicobacter pullorum]
MADTTNKFFANFLGAIGEALDQSSDKGFQKTKEEINKAKKEDLKIDKSSLDKFSLKSGEEFFDFNKK